MTSGLVYHYTDKTTLWDMNLNHQSFWYNPTSSTLTPTSDTTYSPEFLIPHVKWGDDVRFYKF